MDIIKDFCIKLIIFFTIFFWATFSFAKDYTFSWFRANQLVGYKLYYKKGGEPAPPFDGVDADEGESPIELGDITSFTITGLEKNTTYHFALTAYNDSLESDFANVITVQSPRVVVVRNAALVKSICDFLLNSKED